MLCLCMQGRHGKQSPINIILFAMVGVSMVFVSSLASLIVVTHEVHMLLNSFPLNYSAPKRLLSHCLFVPIL